MTGELGFRGSLFFAYGTPRRTISAGRIEFSCEYDHVLMRSVGFSFVDTEAMGSTEGRLTRARQFIEALSIIFKGYTVTYRSLNTQDSKDALDLLVEDFTPESMYVRTQQPLLVPPETNMARFLRRGTEATSSTFYDIEAETEQTIVMIETKNLRAELRRLMNHLKGNRSSILEFSNELPMHFEWLSPQYHRRIVVPYVSMQMPAEATV